MCRKIRPRLLSDKSAFSKEMLSLSKRFDKAVITIIQEGLDDGSFQSKGYARLIMAGIVGMCNWSHRWYEPEGKYDPRADRANLCRHGSGRSDKKFASWPS